MAETQTGASPPPEQQGGSASSSPQGENASAPEQGHGPSIFGTFARGAFGGAMSGVTMSAIVTGLGLAAKAVGLMAFPGLFAMGLTWTLLMPAATAVFGGLMALHRSHEEQAAAQRISRDLVREAETLAASRGMDQAIDPRTANTPDRNPNEPSIDEQDVTNSTSWTARTSRNLRANNRIEALIDQGRQAELRQESRVENLLREREAAALREETAYAQRQ